MDGAIIMMKRMGLDKEEAIRGRRGRRGCQRGSKSQRVEPEVMLVRVPEREEEARWKSPG